LRACHLSRVVVGEGERAVAGQAAVIVSRVGLTTCARQGIDIRQAVGGVIHISAVQPSVRACPNVWPAI
jgi:hypothetical protein